MEATAKKISEVEQRGIMAPPKKAETAAESDDSAITTPTDTSEGMKTVAEPQEEESPHEGPAEPDGSEEPEEEPKKAEKPKEPIYVSKEDLLRAETANQRKLIAAQQLTILQMQINDAMRRSQEASQEVSELQKELGEKYNVNFDLCDIRPNDGMVIPKNPATAAFTRRLMGQ
jgi:hypothetical protein